MSENVKAKIQSPSSVDMALVTGPADGLLRIVEEGFDARITVRGNEIELEGDDIEVRNLTVLFTDMFKQVESGQCPDEHSVRRLINLMKSAEMSPQMLREDIIHTYRGKAIRPKTAGQKHFVDASKEIGRIVLTRPIVEAGESLGFLPGTMMEKVDPYIRPLYDAIFAMMDAQRASRYLDDGTIEITPLAFMRGRTFDDSFVILDEAQNTTPEQMKMFLTRLGFGSKMVVTGDESQSDAPKGATGLKSVRETLGHIDDIAFVELTGKDVVRHSLVQRIVAAYEGK